MENRRRRGEGFAIFLLSIIAGLFSSILCALVFGHLTTAEEMALTGWGGALIGALGTAVAYEWGSSKGSAMKDELAAAGASTVPPGTKIETSSSIDTTTQAQEPKP